MMTKQQLDELATDPKLLPFLTMSDHQLEKHLAKSNQLAESTNFTVSVACLLVVASMVVQVVASCVVLRSIH
jgi:hypothetical protein